MELHVKYSMQQNLQLFYKLQFFSCKQTLIKFIIQFDVKEKKMKITIMLSMKKRDEVEGF